MFTVLCGLAEPFLFTIQGLTQVLHLLWQTSQPLQVELSLTSILFPSHLAVCYTEHFFWQLFLTPLQLGGWFSILTVLQNQLRTLTQYRCPGTAPKDSISFCLGETSARSDWGPQREREPASQGQMWILFIFAFLVPVTSRQAQTFAKWMYHSEKIYACLKTACLIPKGNNIFWLAIFLHLPFWLWEDDY